MIFSVGEGGREGGREREKSEPSMYFSTCVHVLLVPCASSTEKNCHTVFLVT